MSQRCPVCKARLWRHSLLRSKLRCPRCGAEFRATVPSIYLSILFILVVILTVALISLTSGRQLWLLLTFILAAALFIGFLPRLTGLQQIPGKLKMAAEGPENAEALRLELYWEDRERHEAEEPQLGKLLIVSIALLLFCFLLLLLFQG